jgi:endonuclease/exonuclease/phosphatase family metal-dependent hydrolase
VPEIWNSGTSEQPLLLRGSGLELLRSILPLPFWWSDTNIISEMTRKQVTRPIEEIPSNKMVGETSQAHAPVSIRVITHNIRYATQAPFPGEERWPIRRPRLCSELVFNSSNPATFICLQEVLHQQLQDVLESLNQSPASDGEWAYIGVGRDDGKQAGEYSPIFYRPSIWHLKSWETRWLSKTPAVPSKGWDASSIRIVTVGDFIHFETRQIIRILSTHLDDQGSRSREESAKIILSLTEVKNASAILLGGDFNSQPDGGAYKIMTSPESTMEDIALQVPQENRYGNEMTFTSFGDIDNVPSRIDFVFARKGDKTTYRSYGVLANRFDDGVFSSDHRACVADLLLSS